MFIKMITRIMYLRKCKVISVIRFNWCNKKTKWLRKKIVGKKLKSPAVKFNASELFQILLILYNRAGDVLL